MIPHLDASALGMFSAGFGVFGHHVDTFYDSTLFFSVNLDNATLFAAVVTSQNLNGVPFFYVCLAHYDFNVEGF